ncbi:MAG TPA: 30S ribosomal protein S9 [Planctomycetota bacterium]|nr:30S ribosomal protein S9 [Planctomycetota bacterium]HRR81811.1 30S ribosomal protein S9 [Planctomycetota bacterium]HRT96692.1 30S ribosomal protein S9 [Planctomycetota bacterium]
MSTTAAPTAAAADLCWSTGRRKTAVARVRLRRGTGRILVNGREADEYFPIERLQNAVRAPLRAVKAANKYDVLATIQGGGVAAQAGAMLLGVARALVKVDREAHARLKEEGFLTRDSREKERKKYGRKRARARFQFSKR